jgi:hypothetical protein
MHPHLIRFDPPPDSAAVRQKVEEWVRHALHLPPDAAITLTELCCPDPSCPVVETVLLIHQGDSTREIRFAHPKAALTKMHVLHALEGLK